MYLPSFAVIDLLATSNGSVIKLRYRLRDPTMQWIFHSIPLSKKKSTLIKHALSSYCRPSAIFN